jgi:phage gp29-like protein
MSLTQRIVSAVRNALGDTPKPGRVIYPRPEDSVRDYPSSGLTPSRLVSILREADDGSLSAPMQLFEEMEEKDPHLHAVANTRRLALTGLQWQVVSAADVHEGVDRTAADEAAAYCREILSRIDSFDEILQHLALAIGRNIAIAEIVWDVAEGSLQPIELIPVDFPRVVFDDLDRVRILTADAPREGIELAHNKFVVHTPHGVSGHPQRGGLLRVTAMVYLAKNMALKDWMIYSEIFGMPVRIARYEPEATAEEKRELINMLESLGSNAAGIFSKAVELQVVEAGVAKTGPPYESLIGFLNREMSKAWLGQTLTTDIAGTTGSVAAARVHELVRKDILVDDIRREGRTIRRDLLRPMTTLHLGAEVPAPFFRRKIEEPQDAMDMASVLDVAVNQLGLKVPRAWAHESLNVPQAAGDEAVLTKTAG